MQVAREAFTLVGHTGEGTSRQEVLREGLRQADAVITTLSEQVGAALLDQAPHLRVIANYAVGYNNIDVQAAKRKGIVVTNTPDVLTDATADLTWALILAVARRVVEGHQLVQQGGWEGWAPTHMLGADVSGKTLGIVGLGRIGKAVARRAVGFRMPVLYSNRGQAVSTAEPSWRMVSKETVFREADVISLHVPLTAETHHMIDAHALAMMKSSAILINTSRGAVVDEAALVAALQAGQLGGAGLDVYEEEPRLHPGLLGLPQVVTLPHLGSATWGTRVRMGMMCVENIQAVFAGREPPNRVG
jgi:glyoxylate reductase